MFLELVSYRAKPRAVPVWPGVLLFLTIIGTGTYDMASKFFLDWVEISFETPVIPQGSVLVKQHEWKEPFHYDRYFLKGVTFFVQEGTQEMDLKRIRCIWTGKDLRKVDWRQLIQEVDEAFPVQLDQVLLSRVDFAIDVEVEDMPEIDKLEYTTRAKYNRRDSSPSGRTYYFGRRPFTLRIYDKTGELTRSGRMDRLQEYQEFTGLKERVCRVEFELRRDALRKKGIATAADLISGYQSVACNLVTNWFYIPKKKITRKTNEYHPFWAQVVSSVGNYDPLPPVPHKPANADHIVRAAMGMFRAAYASETAALADEKAFLEFVLTKAQHFQPDSWHDFFEDLV